MNIVHSEDLANAIIMQAVLDYRKLGRKLRRCKDDDKPCIVKKMEPIKRFFYSEWFQHLSSLDGPSIIKQLEMEVFSK